MFKVFGKKKSKDKDEGKKSKKKSKKDKKNKVEKDEGSRWASVIVLVVTVIISLGFWVWGNFERMMGDEELVTPQSRGGVIVIEKEERPSAVGSQSSEKSTGMEDEPATASPEPSEEPEGSGDGVIEGGLELSF